MKVLQWNIWNNENVDNIISELKRFDPDVACLQEVYFKKGDKSVLNKFKRLYPYCYFVASEYFEDGCVQGNAILSKFKLCNKHKRFVQPRSNKQNDYASEGRVFVSAKIKTNSSALWVGTTHLSFTPFLQQTTKKDLEVKKLLKELEKHKKNFVFTGDLNSDEKSQYVKEIENLLTRHDTSPTWTTKPFSYQGYEENKLCLKIDHVFTSRDLKVESVKVLKTSFSDHLPIMVNIKI